MWLDGDDLRGLPLVERKKRLRRLLPKRSAKISEAMSLDDRYRSSPAPNRPRGDRRQAQGRRLPAEHALAPKSRGDPSLMAKVP
jgi:hypothetical protein